MRLGKTLAGRILVAVLGIVVVMMVIAAALVAHQASALTDEQAVVQARSIAVSVAAMPDVAEAVTNGDTAALMPALAERIRLEAQADYVVIIDAAGTRYSHPRAGLVGQKIEEPVVALDGQIHTGIDNGHLGRSANVRSPIIGAGGQPVGEVSVGILESTVKTRSAQLVTTFLLSGAVALALGVVASLVLARTIKRVTFGLEPAEIVALVQEREAMLHGIREGVLGIDTRGRVNVVNEEARRLLQMPNARPGQRIEELVGPSQLRSILTGEVTGPDRVAVTDEHLLVLNRMPVDVGGRPAGWVVTIRDRTEMEALLRQLDSVTGLTNALRAQEHEFSNRLHVLSVLLELGETEEAARYSSQLRAQTTLAAEDIRSRIAAPLVVALLLAKTTVAAERDVTVRLDPDSLLEQTEMGASPLVTVMANLVDNAVDAVADDPRTIGLHPRGVVTVRISESRGCAHLRVSDTGPGIPDGLADAVFVDGFTTKPARGDIHRGVGLALVHRLVTRAGGTVAVASDDGAVFDVRLPVSVGSPV